MMNLITADLLSAIYNSSAINGNRICSHSANEF